MNRTKLITRGRKLMQCYVQSVDAWSDLPTWPERCKDAEAHWPKLRQKREEALACAMRARELKEEPWKLDAVPLAVGFSVLFWVVVIGFLVLHFCEAGK